MTDKGAIQRVYDENPETEQQKEVLSTLERKRAWFEGLRMTCEHADPLGSTWHFAYAG